MIKTGAETLASFVEFYGHTDETDNLITGVNRTGFNIVEFDPITHYAHFRERGDVASWECVEYAHNIHNFTIRRRRFYSGIGADKKLYSADFRYTLGGFKKKWWWNYDMLSRRESAKVIPPPTIPIFEVSSQTDPTAILAKCWYRRGDVLPEDIYITAGTIADALRAREQLSSTDRLNKVPNGINIIKLEGEDRFVVFGPHKQGHTLSPRLGFIRPGQTLASEDLPFTLRVERSDKQLRIFRELNDGSSVLDLKLPKIDYLDWYTRIHGPWQQYVNLPAIYPVDFSLKG